MASISPPPIPPSPSHTTGSGITITPLLTGYIRCRPALLTQPSTRAIFLRRLAIILDRSWAAPIPVYAYLLTLPTGRHILFDAGLSQECTNPGYFPWWMPTFHLSSRLDTSLPAQSLHAQLLERGVSIDENLTVVISHLHYDHSGGLENLEGAARILVSKAHWDAFGKSKFWATFNGAVPEHWKKGFKPEFLSGDAGKIGGFDKTYPVTEDGRVVAIETPGHVPGHVSLLVKGDGDAEGEGALNYLLTGDATYGLEYLNAEEVDGVTSTPEIGVKTVRMIKEWAKNVKLVVLPAHDKDAVERLDRGTVYVPTDLH